MTRPEAVVYIATSLDGFIAGPQDELDWLSEDSAPGDGDFGFADFMATIDAVVMGRRTLETVLSFGEWPYEKPVIVLSTTLAAIPDSHRDRAETLSGTPADVLAALGARGMRRLYIDGGATIRGFLDADLIDGIVLTTLPILLGEGLPLFGTRTNRLRFTLAESEILGGRMVKTRYLRRRDA